MEPEDTKKNIPKMNYRIGDLGRIYGLANETLRYYEKQGILHSRRDENSNYRTYDRLDVYRLGIIKNVRNMGFSLNDSIAFHKGRCEKDILDMCMKRCEELRREISRLVTLEEHLTENLILVEEFHQRGLIFTQVVTPRFFRFEAGEGRVPIMEKEVGQLGRSWMQNLFLVEPCSMLYPEEDGRWRVAQGLITTDKNYAELGLEWSNRVKVLEPVEAVSFLVHTLGGENQWDNGIRQQLEVYMEDQGLSYGGNPFYRSVLYYYDDRDVFNNYLQYYVPVIKKEK